MTNVFVAFFWQTGSARTCRCHKPQRMLFCYCSNSPGLYFIREHFAKQIIYDLAILKQVIYSHTLASSIRIKFTMFKAIWLSAIGAS